MEGINNVIDVANALTNSGISITKVKVSENVERDMQSFHGNEYFFADFISMYDVILSQGSELSYEIECLHKGMNISVGVSEQTNIMTLTVPKENSDIELSALFEKKTDGLGHNL